MKSLRSSPAPARWLLWTLLSLVWAQAHAQTTLLNSGFEPPFNALYLIPTQASASITGAIANNWSDNSGWADVTLAYSQESGTPHGGYAAQKIDIQRVGGGGAAMQFLQLLRFTAGNKTTAAVWMKAAAPMSVDLLLRQQVSPFQVYGTATVSLSTQWQRVSVSATTPVTETGCLIIRTQATGTLWLDDSTVDTNAQSVPPLATILSPAEGARLPANSPLTITASALDSDGSIASLSFYRNGILIGSATSAPYSVTWSSPGTGVYALQAIATDNNGATGASSSVKVVVGSGPIVTLSASDPDANKDGLDPGAFSVTRNDPSGALNVQYTLSAASTAVSGVDYQALTGVVSFLDGQTSTLIPVVPLPTAQPDTTVKKVTVTLRAGVSGYLVDTPNLAATVNINPSYAGRVANASWRAAAAARIDQFRRGPLSVTVKDQFGNFVTGAQVHAAMKRHAFKFGTCVDAAWLTANTPDADSYRQTILANFNRVVFANDLKWGPWENNTRNEPALAALPWLESNQVEVRGHNLIWPRWSLMPSNVQTTYNSTLASSGQAAANSFLHTRIVDHITSEATTLAGHLVEWDVLNEPYANHDVQDILGTAEIAAWYQAARAADSAAKLFINDYDIVEANGADLAHQNSYANTIQTLIASAAPLDGIGLQSHFLLPATDPDTILPILDRFAAFNKRLAVTEFDFQTTDEQLQADYTRDYMTLVFSRPEFDSFMTWGFWQPTASKPNGALFRNDWSLKPNGLAYRDLVFRQWWTDVQAQSDVSGQFSTRGFCGDYQVDVTYAGALTSTQVALSNAGAALTVTLHLLYPPTIDVQPNASTVNPGQPANLKVVASAEGSLTYQWRKDKKPIDGATLESYSVLASAESDEGIYDVLVSNGAGTTTSQSVALKINDPIVITAPPTGLNLKLGEALSLGVTVTGEAPISYQWRKDDFDIDAATDSVFYLNAARLTDAGVYRVLISNVVGSVLSEPITVTVQSRLKILSQPVSIWIPEDGTAAFSVEAEGDAPLSYQWECNGETLVGANQSSLVLAGAQRGAYRCVIHDSQSTVTSDSAQLEVRLRPRILEQPRSLSVVAGGSVSLRVSASGYGPLSYQWFREGAALDGATADSLELNPIQLAQAGAYSVIVKNSIGEIASGIAQVQIMDWRAMVGSYQGLLAGEAPPQTSDMETPGRLTISIGSRRVFSARLEYGGVTYSFRDRFDLQLHCTHRIVRGEQLPLLLDFQWAESIISFRLTDTVAAGTSSCVASLRRSLAQELNQTVPQAGHYTVSLQPTSTDLAVPQAPGYLRFTIGAAGSARIVGKLADGTRINSSGLLRADATVSAYQRLYPLAHRLVGQMAGLITVSSAPDLVAGTLTWSCPLPLARSALPGSFLTHLEAVGSRYVRRVSGANLLGPPGSLAPLNFTFESSNASLLAQVVDKTGLRCSVILPNPDGLTLFFSPRTGLFWGQFSDTALGKRRDFEGVLIPSLHRAAGFSLIQSASTPWTLEMPVP